MRDTAYVLGGAVFCPLAIILMIEAGMTLQTPGISTQQMLMGICVLLIGIVLALMVVVMFIELIRRW